MQFRRIVGASFAGGVLAGSLFLAACGGGGDDSDSNVVLTNSNNESGGGSGANAQATPRPEATIEVKDNSFAPDTLTIKAGTKVTWKWSGTSNPHSIQISGQTSPE